MLHPNQWETEEKYDYYLCLADLYDSGLQTTESRQLLDQSNTQQEASPSPEKSGEDEECRE